MTSISSSDDSACSCARGVSAGGTGCGGGGIVGGGRGVVDSGSRWGENVGFCSEGIGDNEGDGVA